MLDEFVALNCDNALTECEEYIRKEYGGNFDEDELRAMWEKLIYKRAVADTLRSLRYFNVL